MNKLNYFLLAATALSLASCSQDEINFPENNGDASLHFSVKLPSTFASRSVGDGTNATTLWVMAYTADGSFLFTNEGDTEFDSEGSANVDLELAPNQSYKIVFFAGSQTALSGDTPVYSISDTDGTLSVNYANMTSEGNAADAYDCFYYTYPVENATVGSFNSTIELTRPVAQINWGTDDLSNSEVTEKFGANGEYIQTRLTATPYTTLNFLTGEVSGNTAEIEFPAFAIPSGETYPAPNATGYSYVALEYLLAPSSAEASMDFTLWISNAGDTNSSSPNVNSVFIDVQDVSVQANYQTNIYGSLITDQTTITVSKDDWDDGTKPELIWDGATRTTPTINTSSRTVSITKASELAGLADYINSGLTGKSLSGYTVTLENDFDMNNFPFTMMGTFTDIKILQTGKFFEGVLDGNGHTIKNLNINGTSNTAGFIACVSGKNASIQNLNFENVTINGTNTDQAGVIAYVREGATVSNVNVKSGSIYSKEGAGGVIGRVSGYGTVTGCTNSANVSVGNQTGGGIAGSAYNTTSQGITISDCYNYGTITCAGTGANNQSIGGIVGVSGANVEGCVNYGNVGDSPTSISTVGGIVGIQYSCGSIKNCQNYGEIQGSTYVGGILGWAGGNTYTLKQVITVSGNTNYGKLTSNGQVGGIMSINRATVNVDDNTNSAPSITSLNGGAAAIVSGGYYQQNPANGGNGYINYGEGNVNTTPADKITGKSTSESYLGTVWLVSDNAASTK